MNWKEDEQPTRSTSHRHEDAGLYQIRVMGNLDARWSGWFDGLRIQREDDGTTSIEGAIADQAALHGLLQRVRDLGLELISVNRIQPD